MSYFITLVWYWDILNFIKLKLAFNKVAILLSFYTSQMGISFQSVKENIYLIYCQYIRTYFMTLI
jgi:hypothetical protein